MWVFLERFQIISCKDDTAHSQACVSLESATSGRLHLRQSVDTVHMANCARRHSSQSGMCLLSSRLPAEGCTFVRALTLCTWPTVLDDTAHSQACVYSRVGYQRKAAPSSER
ncbi:hypothetical protein J6590_006034 [Homalodisca vitripennis]|nr:hypothetical protein J6590_006034 [Homalodisca vitripennis]